MGLLLLHCKLLKVILPTLGNGFSALFLVIATILSIYFLLGRTLTHKASFPRGDNKGHETSGRYIENARKCPKMPENARKCSKMLENARKCSKMLENAQKETIQSERRTLRYKKRLGTLTA